MKKIIILLTLLSLSSIPACYDGAPTLNINGTGDVNKLLKYEAAFNTDKLYGLELTKRDNEEAELMAMCLSGDLIAPESMYNRILSDLALIRTGYADLFAGKSTGPFSPPWVPGCVMIAFLPEAALKVKNGEYAGWNYLNARFGISTVDLSLIDMDIAVVCSDYRLNSRRMADYYERLPDVIYAEVNGYAYLATGPGPRVYPGFAGGMATYLFTVQPSGGTPGFSCEYIYFRMADHGAELVGVWDFDAEEQPAWWEEAEKNIELYNAF